MKGPRIIQKKAIDTEQDPYLAGLRIHDIGVCTECGAIYHDKHWTFNKDVLKKAAGKETVDVLCPACRKIKDRYPEGYVTIEGDFLKEHKDEILKLVRNKEKRAMQDNPLHRIIEIKEKEGIIEITTTTGKLAQRIGRIIKKTFNGQIEYKWSEDVKLARVVWKRHE